MLLELYFYWAALLEYPKNLSLFFYGDVYRMENYLLIFLIMRSVFWQYFHLYRGFLSILPIKMITNNIINIYKYMLLIMEIHNKVAMPVIQI